MTAPLRGWATASDFAARSLAPDFRSIATARDVCGSTLRAWGLTEHIDDVMSVASELVTNALRHGMAQAPRPPAPYPVVLSLLRCGPDVFCAVFDPGDGVPRPRESDPLAESGRGLHIIDALSDAWGWSTPGPYGKAVWSRFSAAADTTPAAAERPHAPWRPPARLLTLVEALTGSSPPRLQAVA